MDFLDGPKLPLFYLSQVAFLLAQWRAYLLIRNGNSQPSL
jgi:hypothetical protein